MNVNELSSDVANRFIGQVIGEVVIAQFRKALP